MSDLLELGHVVGGVVMAGSAVSPFSSAFTGPLIETVVEFSVYFKSAVLKLLKVNFAFAYINVMNLVH